MSVVIKGSEPFDVMIASNIVNCQTANIKFKNISFRCETIEDADGTVFVKMPSAPPERKKGKWIEEEKGIHVTSYRCSECGRTVMDDTGYDVSADYPFCNCGADMRGEQEEQQ